MLEQPLDPGAALTGDAMPGTTPEAPLALDVSTGQAQSVLLDPQGPLGVNLTALAGGPMRLDVLTTPHADVRNSFQGMEFGPGGIFPIGPFDTARVELEGQPGLDGVLPLYLLRASPVSDPGALDETEPGDTDLGALPAEGRRMNGVLLARTDRDTYLMTLDAQAQFDLSAEVQGGSRNFLELRHEGTAILTADMDDGRMFRPGLTLQPGAYQLDISGGQDRPLDYVIDITPAKAAGDGEPDDRPEAARKLEVGRALRGTLGPGNPGYVRFEVPTPGHLWELRGVQGLSNLGLEDGNGTVLGNWEAASGALVLRLALPPGPYTAHLRGDGPYALRLADAGPVPEGLETEPNDTETAAIRIRPGQQVTGDFQTVRDSDFYEFTLAAPTPLQITVTGPDDGPAVFDILAGDAGRLRAELAMGAGPVSYAALYPAGRHLIEVRARDEGVSGRYQLQIDRTNQPEPDEPTGVSAIPGDGLITGRLGGFDAQDHIFVPLPQGAGNLAVVCQGALRFWEVWTYGDEVRLARAEPGEPLSCPMAPKRAVGWACGPLPNRMTRLDPMTAVCALRPALWMVCRV